MENNEIFAALGLTFVVALMLGRWLEARRWRANVKQIQRLESGGKLYKVKDA